MQNKFLLKYAYVISDVVIARDRCKTDRTGRQHTT